MGRKLCAHNAYHDPSCRARKMEGIFAHNSHAGNISGMESGFMYSGGKFCRRAHGAYRRAVPGNSGFHGKGRDKRHNIFPRTPLARGYSAQTVRSALRGILPRNYLQYARVFDIIKRQGVSLRRHIGPYADGKSSWNKA